MLQTVKTQINKLFMKIKCKLVLLYLATLTEHHALHVGAGAIIFLQLVRNSGTSLYGNKQVNGANNTQYF